MTGGSLMVFAKAMSIRSSNCAVLEFVGGSCSYCKSIYLGSSAFHLLLNWLANPSACTSQSLFMREAHIAYILARASRTGVRGERKLIV